MGGADAPACHDQILHFLSNQGAVRNRIPASRLQEPVLHGGSVGGMDVNGISAHGDGIGEHPISQKVLGGQLIAAIDLPAFPDANVGAGGDNAAILKSGDVIAHERHDLMGLPPPFNLGFGELEGINRGFADDPGHIQNELSGIVGFEAKHHIPVDIELSAHLGSVNERIRALNAGPGDLLQMVKGNGGEHILGIGLNICHYLFPVHIGDFDIHRHGLRQIIPIPAIDAGYAGVSGKVRIRAAVQEHVRRHVEEAVFGIEGSFGDSPVFHGTAGVHSMVEQMDAGFQRHGFQHQLHALRVKGGDAAGIAHKILHVAGR